MARLAVSGTSRSDSLRSPRGHVLVKVAVGDFPTFLEGFRFQAFLDDPEVKDSMRAGGALGRPSITFLAAADELDS